MAVPNKGLKLVSEYNTWLAEHNALLTQDIFQFWKEWFGILCIFGGFWGARQARSAQLATFNLWWVASDLVPDEALLSWWVIFPLLATWRRRTGVVFWFSLNSSPAFLFKLRIKLLQQCLICWCIFDIGFWGLYLGLGWLPFNLTETPAANSKFPGSPGRTHQGC